MAKKKLKRERFRLFIMAAPALANHLKSREKQKVVTGKRLFISMRKMIGLIGPKMNPNGLQLQAISSVLPSIRIMTMQHLLALTSL